MIKYVSIKTEQAKQKHEIYYRNTHQVKMHEVSYQPENSKMYDIPI